MVLYLIFENQFKMFPFFIINERFIINCNYESINYLNKLYFLFELSNEFGVYIENPLEMINNVEIKKICFK